jgi:site-specific DNA-methyltransferase (adenine-specific)
MLDVASTTHSNAKCEKHYTIEEEGLKQPWEPANYDKNTKDAFWCNPPSSRGIKYWMYSLSW